MHYLTIIGRLLIVLSTFIFFVRGHWTQHYRYRKDGSARNKRQIDAGSPAQIDLNITVPFIFSARLYPYGEAKGDKVLDPNLNTQAYILKNEMTFLEENYTAIYISKDGAVGFSPGLENVKKDSFPKGPKMIAVYWTEVSLGDTGRVYFRETEDDNVLQLAASEVQIQYRYGQDFKPKSVFIITWENVAPPHASKDLPNSQRNLYQMAFIVSNNGTFAHTIYSKLKWHDNAIVGFNHGDRRNFINLPNSGTPRINSLANNSDIGIPGEWLFKIDGRYVFLCGPGFKGMECVNRCDRGEFYYDCSRRCHCANNNSCNAASGLCPQSHCAKGWDGPPSCETDIDECLTGQGKTLCTTSQPDCINTPGAYICTCLTGFDNSSQICHGNSLFANPFRPSSNTVGPLGIGATAGFVSNSSPVVIVPSFIAPPYRGPPNTAFIPIEPQPASGPHSPSFGAAGFGSSPSTKRQEVLSNNTVELHPENPIVVPTLRNDSANNPLNFTSNFISSITIIPQTLHPFVQQFNLTTTTTIGARTPVIVATTASPLCNLPCPQNAHCEIAQGSTKCVCNAGWTGDGNYCVDVNECFLDHACEGNARCQNTLGSYTCICEEGFQSNGKQCVDVDECAEGVVQCPSANTSTCINTHGSYECRCRVGYNGNPGSALGCIDINECLIPEFYCGGFADCENTLGGFRCHCHQGYQRNSDGTGCEDTDECKSTSCSKAAICRNTPGSFQCSCVEGYSGDGFDCEETLLYPFSRTSADEHKLPQQLNAVIEVPLIKPMKVFNRQINRIYVSANGVITFDHPLDTYNDVQLKDAKFFGVAPLYQKIDLTKRGGVYVRETSEYSYLTRAGLNVQEEFHDQSFRANYVFVVTYDDVIEVNETDLAKANTFQTVLVSGDQGTYVTLIYDRINNEKAQAAILSPESNSGMVLPSSSVNATMLKDSSNIGVKGKWMYKIDDKTIMQCPYGLLDPPFCATDIDECSNGQNKCHQKAACSNTLGSYQCICQPGWTGDGYRCFELTMCFMATGAVCGLNAGCFVPSNGSTPSCMCNGGYFGDGQTCFVETTTEPVSHQFETLSHQVDTHVTNSINTTVILSVTQATSIRYNISSIFVTKPIIDDLTTSYPTDHQTVGPVFHVPPLDNLNPPDVQHVDNSISDPPTSVIHAQHPDQPSDDYHPPQDSHHPQDSHPAQDGSKGAENENNLLNKFAPSQQNKKTSLDSNSTNMLVIIIPAVLCGVWLILIIVLLIVCMRKRKQKQRDKYGLGYYLPSTSSNKGSTINSYAAPYGSQWNVPRPTYDYYHGTYYPDPYNPYKY